MLTTKTKIGSLALAISIALSANALSAQDETPNRFIERKAEGWFWYAQEPTEPEPKETIIVEADSAESEHPAEPEKIQPAGPSVFSAKWFRDNLPKYKDLAWDDPTIENVQTYLYLQRYAMDRSEQFADVAEMAVTGNPMLDEMTRRPTATFGSQKVDQVAGRLRENLVAELANQVGVFFFYEPDDEYSQAAAPLIKLLEQTGFAIVAISKTGEPIPGHEMDFDYKQDQGHAEQLNVSTYPAIFLASVNGEFAPVGQGLMSLPDMTNRMLLVAKREGWISDEDFNKTRPLTNSDNISEMLSANKFGPTIQTLGQAADMENDNYVDPKQLMEFIKHKTRGYQ